jgi:hypothetical protein
LDRAESHGCKPRLSLPARWLPGLAGGQVGGLAFLAVCGLLGISLALVGIHAYEIVRALDQVTSNLGGVSKADVLANGLVNILRDTGPVLGLAFTVYLLAPSGEEDPTRGTV